MKFQSHVPDFCDHDPAIPKGNFASIEKLLEHPWIKSWNQPEQKDFDYYYSRHEGRWSNCLLMAMWTNKEGRKEWWVLGYMDEIPVGYLPEWVCPK